MNSDDEQTEPPDANDVAKAYHAYQRSKSAYLETLARYVAARPSEVDPQFPESSRDIAALRVLHALSVGYGWSDAIFQVCTRAQVAQAQLRGLIARDELHGGLTLTRNGVELLRYWTDYVAPLAEKHHRYRDLWRAVTSLDG